MRKKCVIYLLLICSFFIVCFGNDGKAHSVRAEGDPKGSGLVEPGSIEVSEENFPNYRFREHVSYYDLDKDGYLSKEEREKITRIEFHSDHSLLVEMKGIEYFPNLIELGVYSGELAKLDLRNNINLEILDCANNSLMELDLCNNTKLKKINCSGNDLQALDLSMLTELTELDCSGNNLETLDLSQNKELMILKCSSNNLSEINVGRQLRWLNYANNPMSKIDFSEYINLVFINCSGNDLQSVDVSGNPLLEQLYCSRNGITTIDVSENSKLKTLVCADNQLTEIDVSACTELERLECNDNLISEIDTTGNEGLHLIKCYHNPLKELRVNKDNTKNYYVDFENVKDICLDEYTSVLAYADVKAIMTDDTIKVQVFDILEWETKIVDAEMHYEYYINPNDVTTVSVDGGVSEDGFFRAPLSLKMNSVWCKYRYEDNYTIRINLEIEYEEEALLLGYRTHIQGIGWQGAVFDGQVSGTSGQSRRLEAIEIRLNTTKNMGIQYTTHCQTYGWLPWSKDGEVNGTEGESKRLEAIKIQLTGTDSDLYDVYYRVHAQNYGWLGWAKNGAMAGTSGLSKRLEAIQIVVVEKGTEIDKDMNGIISVRTESAVIGNGNAANPSVLGEKETNVAVRTHVQTYGWQGWKYNGDFSGTSGQSKRLEAIQLKLTNQQYRGSIEYRTHVQTYGWLNRKANGETAGITGESKRLEAIQINLTGEMAEHYDVYYRVHAQKLGWLGWAKNGENAGTAFYSYRLEAIQVVLVPKGDGAPPNIYKGITGNIFGKAYVENSQ